MVRQWLTSCVLEHFVGVAVQDMEIPARRFAAEMGVSFPLLIDDGSVMERYATPGLPTTWFIDRDGLIVGKQLGEISETDLADRLSTLFGETS